MSHVVTKFIFTNITMIHFVNSSNYRFVSFCIFLKKYSVIVYKCIWPNKYIGFTSNRYDVYNMVMRKEINSNIYSPYMTADR